jgi:D-alanyl-D-alanine dipeptidase
MKADLVFVDEFVPGVRCDAKYATWDNFTGKPVDGYLANRIVGTRALCGALERAREAAEQKLRRQRLPAQLLPRQAYGRLCAAEVADSDACLTDSG